MGVRGVMGAERGSDAKRDAHITPLTRFAPTFSIRVYLRLFAAILFTVMAVGGCGRHSGGGNGAAVLRYPISLEPLSLDPAVLNETPTIEMLQNIFEGLVTFDAENRVVPCLAEKWEISPDGQVYTFHLRAN